MYWTCVTTAAALLLLLRPVERGVGLSYPGLVTFGRLIVAEKYKVHQNLKS